jgi:spermidine/putrescine transport system ATP-binding protein
MIELATVSKIYGAAGPHAVTALSGVSFTINENEFFTLLGPSGCGKTTLLRLIAGFEAPSGGAIVLDGTDIAPQPPHKRPINTVFQNYALFPHMSVAQNVAFGLENLGRPRAEVAATVERMLALVKLGHLAGRRTSALSGGQQQRVALARALAPAPRILLLDEPLSALDLKLRKEMQIELKRLQHETGITFIFVTHDQEEALTMSDRIAVMSGGHVHQIASPRDLYELPADRFVADFIGEGNFFKAERRRETAAEIEFDISGHRVVLPPGTAAAPWALIRPEQFQLDSEGGDPSGRIRFDGVVENIVYLGTDTYLHLKAQDGSPVVARVQNNSPSLRNLEVGHKAALSAPLDAIRLVQE